MVAALGNVGEVLGRLDVSANTRDLAAQILERCSTTELEVRAVRRETSLLTDAGG